jgi:hypothetical protein
VKLHVQPVKPVEQQQRLGQQQQQQNHIDHHVDCCSLPSWSVHDWCCAASRVMERVERAERAERAAVGWPVVRLTSAAAVEGATRAASCPGLRSAMWSSLGQFAVFVRPLGPTHFPFPFFRLLHQFLSHIMRVRDLISESLCSMFSNPVVELLLLLTLTTLFSP